MKKLFLLLFVVVLCGAAFGQTVVVGAQKTVKDYPKCNGSIVPCRITLTGQTLTIGDTVLYTPSADGMFRASLYVVTTAAGTGGTVLLGVKYKPDSNCAQRLQATSTAALTSANNQQSALFAFSGQAGQPIYYYTTVGSGAGSYAYRIDVVLE